MPEPLAIDRSMVQVLVYQGVSTKEIAAKTGVKRSTIQQWCHRYGWRVAKGAAATIMDPAPKLELAHPDDIASPRIKLLLQNQIARLLHIWSQVSIEPKLDVLREHTDIAASVTTTADRLYGWSKETDARGNKLVEVSSARVVDVEVEPSTADTAQSTSLPSSLPST